MKPIWASILALLILATTFRAGVVYVRFKLNEQYIAQNLCEDRQVVESDCGGKCCLKTKFTETQQSTPQTPAPVPADERTILLFCMNSIHKIQELDNANETLHSRLDRFSTSSGHLSRLFRPPKTLI